MKLWKHLLVVPGIVLLMAALSLAGGPYILKSGDTTPEIDVEMWKSADGTTCAVIIDPNDITVYYTEEGAAQESYSDAVECTSEAAAWVAKSCISRPSKNSMRICLPTDAVDGGIGKYVKVWVTTGTYEGSELILLGPPTNAYLSDGSTPPDINVTAGVVESNVIYVNGAAPGTAASYATSVWQDTTAADFTTAGSIGKSLYTSGNAPGAASGLSIVGSAMTLADDAITAAKYDESTAFPLAAASSSLATAAELAKVPKSDGSTSWNATALAAIANAILATALTEPTAGASPDLPTLDQAISWLYSRWFNKSITTGTEYQLFKRNESDKIYEQDYSDDGSNLTVGEAKAAD